MTDIASLANQIAGIKNLTVRAAAQKIFDMAGAANSDALYQSLGTMLGKSASVSGKTAIFNSGGSTNYDIAKDCANNILGGNGYQLQNTDAGKFLTELWATVRALRIVARKP